MIQICSRGWISRRRWNRRCQWGRCDKAKEDVEMRSRLWSRGPWVQVGCSWSRSIASITILIGMETTRIPRAMAQGRQGLWISRWAKSSSPRYKVSLWSRRLRIVFLGLFRSQQLGRRLLDHGNQTLALSATQILPSLARSLLKLKNRKKSPVLGQHQINLNLTNLATSTRFTSRNLCKTTKAISIKFKKTSKSSKQIFKG